ncbi:MAG: AlpA family phage regulatory protein [Deltaproteobacteria bacterium]|jgi:prophage regulatory protein|nr:AlpA family phage regulatory protein [Deltaproteobacteria bacterium]
MNEKIMLRRKPLLEWLGISAPTLWRWINKGDFPEGKRLSERTRIWDRDEVLEWLNNRDRVA